MESEFLDFMPDTITVEPPDGTYSDRGVPNYGAAVSYICRIQPANGEEVVYGPEKQERRAAWRILVNSTSAINPLGRLTLPAGFDPQQPPFFSVGRVADDVGAHHYVILV